MPKHPLSEQSFTNVLPKPLLTQPVAYDVVVWTL